jgi:adenylate cyclase
VDRHNKYIGDAVMAFWNAPLPNERHARDACLAALAMRRQLADLNAELALEAEARGEPFAPLRIGVGINTGACFVGNLGSDQRFNYSVIGDPVNIASRLEARSKVHGVDIVIGESSRAAAPELAALELDRVQLVGRTQPTRTYVLVGDAELAGSAAFQELTACHAAMLQAYRAGDWDAAEHQLERCRERAGPYALVRLYDSYAARIRRLRLDPPGPGWDGSEAAPVKA